MANIDKQAAKQEIDAVMREYERLVQKQDSSGVAAFYAHDARYLPPDAPAAEGREAIQQATQWFFDLGFRRMRLATVRLDVIEDLAIKQSTFEADLEPRGAAAVTVVGKDIEILHRQPDGSWLFVADIFNLDAPLRR